jgi:hypothetical protein
MVKKKMKYWYVEFSIVEHEQLYVVAKTKQQAIDQAYAMADGDVEDISCEPVTKEEYDENENT